jgi:DNA-binding HxlR family transcriptional regulator
VQHAIEVVGDRWSLLVVRQLMLGATRFNIIQRETGVPRDRLADRLRKLEQAGVIARNIY